MPRFEVTVRALDAPASKDAPTSEHVPAGKDTQPLVFVADNHDDILAIARRMNGRFDMDEATSNAFAIGMKLFGEVLLKNRTREPFATLRPAMAEFMKAVKAGRPPAATG